MTPVETSLLLDRPDESPAAPAETKQGEDAPSERTSGVRDVFRIARFRLLLGARTMSVLGNGLAPVAIAFAVLDLRDSGVALGLVLGVRALVTLPGLLLGGVLADRMSRSKLMVITDLIAGICQIVTAILFFSGHAAIWNVALLQGINGFAAAVFLPTSSAVIPQVVPSSHLQAGNAILGFSIKGSMMLGALLGGALYALVGPGWTLTVDAATFLISAAISMRLRTPRVRNVKDSSMASLREGWKAFWARDWLWSVVIQFTVVNAAFMGTMEVLGPLIAKHSLHGASSWALVLAANSIGLLGGGIISLRLRTRRPLRTGTFATFLLALPMLALVSTLNMPLLMLAAFGAGVGAAVFVVLWDTTMQSHIPNDLLARASAFDAFGSFGAVPIAMALYGVLSRVVGIDRLLWISAVLIIVAGAAVLLVRDVRELPLSPHAAQNLTDHIASPQEVMHDEF